MSTTVLNFILLFLSLGSIIKAQQITDNNFAAAIRQQCPACIDVNNKLTAAADEFTSLDVRNKNIKNLAGFHFIKLEKFNCSNNQLASLPNKLPNSLIELDCSNNQLTSLPNELPNSLIELDCSNNQLVSLPNKLPNRLEEFYCDNNKLVSLPNKLPNSLIVFTCYENKLMSLPNKLSNSLKVLSCSFN